MTAVLDQLRAAGFRVLTRNHADAILTQDFAAETAELVEALLGFRLPVTEIIGSGGGEAPSTQRLRRRLSQPRTCARRLRSRSLARRKFPVREMNLRSR